MAERRRVDRPRNGDLKVCSSCGAVLEFNERYRLEGQIVPAWICDNAGCKRREVVRAAGRAAVQVSQRQLSRSAQVQPRAKPAMLKSRARDEKSRKRGVETEARIKGKAS